MFELKSIYLNSAYTSPMPLKAKDRVEETLRLCLDPAFVDFEERAKVLDKVREKMAKLLGAPALNIALSTSVSELVGHIANGLELHQADNVILMENDFPSMILPWMVVAELKGLQVRLLPRETFMQTEKLAEEINDRTRFVACSHVMFNTGLRLPVAGIGKICREKEVLFLADTSQSFGAIRISPDIVKNVDILVGVAYKWLLGPYGSAYGYFSDGALKQIRRSHASWMVSTNSQSTENLLNYTTEALPGARIFDRGESTTHLITAALDGALDVVLGQGLEKIEKHNLALAKHFLENLPESFSTFSDEENFSPIVCVKSARESGAAIKKRLAAEGIDVSLREGYIRVSFHFFNTIEQVDRLIEVLKS